MSTFHSLYFHWICATKERRPFIQPAWRGAFHDYLGGTVRGLGGTSLKVGGVEDHVHLLFALRTTHCLADFSRELKKASSIWATGHHRRDFAWQEGYTVFSVSKSVVDAVRTYIAGQEEHHRKRPFVDELEIMLRRHNLAWDPRFLP